MALQAERHEDGRVELWDFFQDGGPVVICYPDGKVELYKVPQYGGDPSYCGDYPNVCAALSEAEKWT